MQNPKVELAGRIRTMRRRHFGPRGKDEFSRRLGIDLEQYDRFERGALPPGDLLVRMCELTGEDLQWLLTGVAGRGTVVISGARGRHQQLLSKIAETVERRPELASPIEAFVALLTAEPRLGTGPRLGVARPAGLIPILPIHRLPPALADDDDYDPDGFALPAPLDDDPGAEHAAAFGAQPAARYEPADLHALTLVTPRQAGACTLVQLQPPLGLLGCDFGARLEDDAMSPMFRCGDAVLVSRSAPPRAGAPALCRLRSGDGLCRIWLGAQGPHLNLGRLSDGAHEQIEAGELVWSLEVLLRVTRAA